MGNSQSSNTMEHMKPYFVKAGLPLVAVSVTGFWCSRIISRRYIKVNSSSVDLHCENFIDKASDNCSSYEDKMMAIPEFSKSVEMLDFCDDKADGEEEEEKSCLTSRIQVLEEKVKEVESRLLHRQVIRQEHESLLQEIKNVLTSKASIIELLHTQVSITKAERESCEDLIQEHLKVVKKLQEAKMKNGLLQRKVKKFVRKNNEYLTMLRQKNLKVKDMEEEVSKCFDEVEKRNCVNKELEGQVEELNQLINCLQEEKLQLSVKLRSAEEDLSSSFSKSEVQGVPVDDYNKLVNELEQLRNNREAETAELIYLRWTNACLRNELMRHHYAQEKKKNNCSAEHEGSGDFEDAGLEQLHREDGSKQKKVMMESNENRMRTSLEEKEKSETKCSRRHSVSEDLMEENLAVGRRFFFRCKHEGTENHL